MQNFYFKYHCYVKWHYISADWVDCPKSAMDDEERLEGEEEMELDEASDGEDEDEETAGIPVSPANSDQLLGQTPTPGKD